MILLREIQEKDLDALEQLAQIPGFINLTADRDALREKIAKSTASFRDELPMKDGKYLFVAEDLDSKRVLGTSMIAAQHGTVESPHFYFEVGSEEKFSAMINTGFIHGTLKLKYDTNGPTELGGLVMDPLERNSPLHIGRQISFIRFLFLGLNRQRFKRKVLAELLPPLNKKGQSPLWEAIGRRFTNMDYWEADNLCQQNKEFIFSLFPTGKIYTTFLSAEARNAIGKVGKETEPVVHMLNKIGFQYKNQVDPFDGGPHLWANVDDIAPIKHILKGHMSTEAYRATEASTPGLLCKSQHKAGEFRAIRIDATASGLLAGKIITAESASICDVLKISSGDEIIFMPFY